MAIRAHKFALTALTALLVTGCPPVDAIDPIDENPVVTIDADIVGSWISEGGDIAALLLASDVVRVDATFEDDATYVVTSTDSTGAEIDFTGTYAIDDSTSPASIVLTQDSPYAATVEGIWEYGNGELTYEVVQSGLGFTAPTPDSGFGSTSGPGLESGWNIQTYR